MDIRDIIKFLEGNSYIIEFNKDVKQKDYNEAEE